MQPDRKRLSFRATQDMRQAMCRDVVRRRPSYSRPTTQRVSSGRENWSPARGKTLTLIPNSSIVVGCK
jgi:hypothetical protein